MGTNAVGLWQKTARESAFDKGHFLAAQTFAVTMKKV